MDVGEKFVQVETSRYFDEIYPTLDILAQQAVAKFVAHVEQNGLKGLAGRNKSSVPINPHSKKERDNAKIARKHCLWHYHIGVPYYVGEHGDMTSEYILHYQRFNDKIVIVDMTSHPPFTLPSLDNLTV